MGASDSALMTICWPPEAHTPRGAVLKQVILPSVIHSMNDAASSGGRETASPEEYRNGPPGKRCRSAIDVSMENTDEPLGGARCRSELQRLRPRVCRSAGKDERHRVGVGNCHALIGGSRTGCTDANARCRTHSVGNRILVRCRLPRFDLGPPAQSRARPGRGPTQTGRGPGRSAPCCNEKVIIAKPGLHRS